MFAGKQTALRKVLLTCEHGGNEIPAVYKKYFKNAGKVLSSHRGYDPGCLDLFNHLVYLGDFHFFSLESRLLIELNRSLHHKQLFSEFTNELSKSEKSDLIDTYYLPYRLKAEDKIKDQLKKNRRVNHFSIHSFTPVLNGKKRNMDIGLLYDPSRKNELDLCRNIKQNLKKVNPDLVVRMNTPYKGTSDGFTTYLRSVYRKGYTGIEIEVNQKFVSRNKMPVWLKQNISMALEQSLT